jgi:hypothetical protein
MSGCRHCGQQRDHHVAAWCSAGIYSDTYGALRSQLSALREALQVAQQALQFPQDPCGTRAALARIDAALASTEPGGEEEKR